MSSPFAIPATVRAYGSPEYGFDDLESSNHRRQIVDSLREVVALLQAMDPSVSTCSADTTVSSGTFISVTGMAQTLVPPYLGDYDLQGVLYIEEATPGQMSVRIVQKANVLWTTTVQEQGSPLRQVGGATQLAIWTMPIGGPELLAVTGLTSYAIDVEIAAPTGSYKVLTGSGAESWLSATLRPQLEA